MIHWHGILLVIFDQHVVPEYFNIHHQNALTSKTIPFSLALRLEPPNLDIKIRYWKFLTITLFNRHCGFFFFFDFDLDFSGFIIHLPWGLWTDFLLHCFFSPHRMISTYRFWGTYDCCFLKRNPFFPFRVLNRVVLVLSSLIHGRLPSLPTRNQSRLLSSRGVRLTLSFSDRALSQGGDSP